VPALNRRIPSSFSRPNMSPETRPAVFRRPTGHDRRWAEHDTTIPSRGDNRLSRCPGFARKCPGGVLPASLRVARAFSLVPKLQLGNPVPRSPASPPGAGATWSAFPSRSLGTRNSEGKPRPAKPAVTVLWGACSEVFGRAFAAVDHEAELGPCFSTGRRALSLLADARQLAIVSSSLISSSGTGLCWAYVSGKGVRTSLP